jgi:hypothetical protein
MQKISGTHLKTIGNYIKNHPTASYSEFAKSIKNVPISDCYYYTLRRKITGVVRDTRKKSNTYVRLFLADSKEVSTEARTLLQKFIESLNITLSTKIEMIETGFPSKLEIRELKA